MMHEYAKDIKKEPRSGSAKPFKVRRFKNLQEAVACVEQYQEETVTHFIKYNRDKQFGNESYLPNVERGRIHYWSHTGKCGVPIEYDGVPFMHVGRWVLMCHQGHDTNKGHKEKYQMRKIREQQESGVIPKSRNRSQVSKKVDCPAEIYITHIMKFPQHKVPSALLAINSLPTDHMRKLAKKRMITCFRRQGARFPRESWYYVRLPDPTTHEGHPVLGMVKQEVASNSVEECLEESVSKQPIAEPEGDEIKRKRQSPSVKFRTKEPVDPRVLTKMYELTRQGVTTVKMMQEAIADFVREELFPCEEPPPSMYRRYNPTSSDIQNAMYKVKQEMRLEGKSILQYRCAALVREVTDLVVRTDSEEYLIQLEEQLRNIYNAVRHALPIQEVPFRSEVEGEKGRHTAGQVGAELMVEALSVGGDFLVPESKLNNNNNTNTNTNSKRGRRRKHSTNHLHHHNTQQQQQQQEQQQQQAEIRAATYHLKLENQNVQDMDPEQEQDQDQDQLVEQVTTTEDLAGVLDQYQVHEIIQQEDGTIMEVYYCQPSDPDHTSTIIIQPENIKTEPIPVDYV